MMGYKDKTWCTDNTCANWQKCSRAFKKEDAEAAKKWWKGPDFPLVTFAGRVDCYEEPKKGEE